MKKIWKDLIDDELYYAKLYYIFIMLLTQDYLSNVNINDDLKSILMNKLNEKLEGLDVESKIEEHFDNYSGSSKWVKC